ncbi:FAD/NAD(P)-binding domain-containing protein [Xylariaceae sp. FL1651]|nr:FAD/NAD(P)-binding domain-containing protein [Xylariaceae sp. FL1651]
MESWYEIIVIGGGPAGLSAVSSIVRQGHKVVLLNSQKDAEDFRAASRDVFLWYGSVTAENAEVVFHYLFSFDWEAKRSSTASILAEGGIVNTALRFARQALLMVDDNVTIYTNGNEQLAMDLARALSVAPAPIEANPKKITRLVKIVLRSHVKVYFEDGTSTTEGFLVHRPKMKLRSDPAQQLELELTLEGVFAAGDYASYIQTVASALNSGMLAGRGAPLQIQAKFYNQDVTFLLGWKCEIAPGVPENIG